jgi:hypothetical protein
MPVNSHSCEKACRLQFTYLINRVFVSLCNFIPLLPTEINEAAICNSHVVLNSVPYMFIIKQIKILRISLNCVFEGLEIT